jgi:murein DD-endopeptidase MepM/ murein hydrolase activator NlpD
VDTLVAEDLERASPAADTAVVPPIDIDSLIAEIRADARTEREVSILPFGLVWTPAVVEEGSGVAFRVLEPRGGRQPVAIRGTFAGAQVRFGRLGSAWLGLAAVPIDTSGPQRIDLSFEFADGSAYRQGADVEVLARTWDRSTLRVAPRFSSPPPEVRDRIARERQRIRFVLDHVSPEWLVRGPFEAPRPVDVTAEYGQERVFNNELQSRHTGLDLRGSVGDPVRASGRGRVVLTGDFYFSGNGVFVDHGLGVYTGYFHLSEILVTEGQMVEPGDLVGRVGATGRVTGPHLHWSLWIGGTGQDAGSLLRMDIPAP